MKQHLSLKKIAIFYFIFCGFSIHAQTFPHVGTLTFSPIVDGQQAIVATADKPLMLGPLKLDSATLTELATKENTFQGHGTFLNKEVRVAGKNFTKDAAGNYTQGTLFISYGAQPELTLPELPPITLQETQVVVQENVEPVATIQTTFAGQPTTITVQRVQNKVSLSLNIKSIQLGSLLPRLQASSFAAVSASDVQINVADVVQAPNAVTIQGQADAAVLARKKGLVADKAASLAVTLDESSMQGSLSLGFVRQLALGTIDKAHLVFKVEKGVLQQQLVGSHSLSLSGAKTVTVTIASPLEQKEQTIEGTISQPLEFDGSQVQGTVLQEGATLRFDLAKTKLTVEGQTTHLSIIGSFRGGRAGARFDENGAYQIKKSIEIDGPMKATITREYVKNVPGIVMLKATAQKDLKLPDVIFDPRLKLALSQLDAVTLSKVTFTVNTVSGETKVAGSADLTDLLKDEYEDPFDFDMEKDKKSVAFDFVLKTNALEFYLDIGKVTIPGLGTLDEVKLGTEIKTFGTTAPPLILSGTINLPIPEIGNVPIALTTKFLGKEARAGGETKFLRKVAGVLKRPKEFTGVIKEVTYKNFTLKDASITFNTQQKKFTIGGQAIIYDYPTVLTLSWEKGKRLEARAVLTEKELRPFGDVPHLSEVVFTNPAIKFVETTDRELVLSGSLRIFNEHFAATLAFITPGEIEDVALIIPGKEGRPAVTIEGKTEKKLARKETIIVATTEIIDPHTVAAFKDSVVNAISIENAKIIVTSRDYRRTRKELGTIRGITVRLSDMGKRLFDAKQTIDPHVTNIPELDALNERFNGSIDEVSNDILFISFDQKIGTKQLAEYEVLKEKGFIITVAEDPGAAVPDEVAVKNPAEAAQAKRKRKKPTKDFLYRRGVSLEGEVVLSGYLSPAAALSKKPEATKVAGLINVTLPKVLDSTLIIKMFTPIRIVEKLSLKDLVFEVRGLRPPKILLAARAVFNPQPKKTIIFALKGGFSVGKVTMLELAGSAEGSWEQVFGLPLTLKNMGLGLGILIPPAPAKFALTGALETPKKTIGVTVSVDLPDMKEVGLVGEVSSLSLAELIAIGINPNALFLLKPDRVPNFELTDVKMYIAPKSFSIGALTFTEGIGGEGKLRIFGHHSRVSFKKSYDSYYGTGFMDPFNIGAVRISGKTAERGPEVQFELSKSRQNFIIAGDISIGKFLKKHGEITLTDEIISFSVVDQWRINEQAKFGYTAYAYIPRKLAESVTGAVVKPAPQQEKGQKKELVKKTVRAIPWAAKEILDLDFRVKITFDNTLGDYITTRIANRLHILQDNINQSLGKAREKLEAKKETAKMPRLNKASREVLLSSQKFLNNVLGGLQRFEQKRIKVVQASFEGSASELLLGTLPRLNVVIKVGDKELTYTLRNILRPQEAIDKIPEMAVEDVEKDLGIPSEVPKQN